MSKSIRSDYFWKDRFLLFLYGIFEIFIALIFIFDFKLILKLAQKFQDRFRILDPLFLHPEAAWIALGASALFMSGLGALFWAIQIRAKDLGAFLFLSKIFSFSSLLWLMWSHGSFSIFGISFCIFFLIQILSYLRIWLKTLWKFPRNSQEKNRTIETQQSSVMNSNPQNFTH